MLLVQPALVPSTNPLGLKGPSRFRWTAQPRCRQIGLVLRATVTGERPTAEGLAQRDHDVAGTERAEEDGREQKDESKSTPPPEDEKKRGPHPLKGRKRPTDVVAKMVASMRNRGPHSEETKEKMRQAHLNKRHTLVTRIKISKSRAGQRVSEETRRKMSIARKQYWENWHQEKMKLQPAEPSKEARDIDADALEEPKERVPRPKRKAWHKQQSESKGAEE